MDILLGRDLLSIQIGEYGEQECRRCRRRHRLGRSRRCASLFRHGTILPGGQSRSDCQYRRISRAGLIEGNCSWLLRTNLGVYPAAALRLAQAA